MTGKPGEKLKFFEKRKVMYAGFKRKMESQLQKICKRLKQGHTEGKDEARILITEEQIK